MKIPNNQTIYDFFTIRRNYLSDAAEPHRVLSVAPFIPERPGDRLQGFSAGPAVHICSCPNYSRSHFSVGYEHFNPPDMAAVAIFLSCLYGSEQWGLPSPHSVGFLSCLYGSEHFMTVAVMRWISHRI